MLRAYRIGDEEKINMSSESREEWVQDISFPHLRDDETYTCLNSKGEICAIASFCLQGEDVYYCWAVYDKDRGHLAVRDFRKIVDLYTSRGKICYTISSKSDKQTKLHRLIGLKEKESMGDEQVWVA